MTRFLTRFCPILLILLLSSQAVAGEFSGYAEAKGFAYAERSARHDPLVTGWGTLFTKWEQKAGDSQITASVRGEWLSSDEQGGRMFDPADRQIRRPPLSMADLWLRHPLSSHIDLQVGRFQLGWGKTDGYSPADAFLPRDLTDPFSDEKIPLWAVRLNGEDGPLRYDAVICPITTPWRLPPLGSRNAPLAVEGIPPGTVFVESDTPPPVDGFAALRLMATFGAWDLGGWARGGVRPAPILKFRFDRATSGPSGLRVPVERRYAREEGVGIELSRVIDAWIVRGEAAALFSNDRDLGDAAIWALSIEKGFGDGTLLITLAGNGLGTPVDTQLLYDRGILPALIAAWKQSEEWGEWKVVWTEGLRHGDGLLKAELGYNITDSWKITVGGELPYGYAKGPLGALHDARRLHAALRLSW